MLFKIIFLTYKQITIKVTEWLKFTKVNKIRQKYYR